MLGPTRDLTERRTAGRGQPGVAAHAGTRSERPELASPRARLGRAGSTRAAVARTLAPSGRCGSGQGAQSGRVVVVHGLPLAVGHRDACWQPEPALTVQAVRSRNIRLGDGALRIVRAAHQGNRYGTKVDTGTAPVQRLIIGHTLPRGSPAAAP